MANNPIKYGLRENLFTADPDDCMAQVVDARSYSQEDIAAEMIKRGSSLTAADIAAYQKLEAEVYADIIANGGNVNTPLINTSFSITGVFPNQTDSFDKTRHAIKLNVNAGSALREAASKVGFLLRSEERHSADLLEIDLDGVVVRDFVICHRDGRIRHILDGHILISQLDLQSRAALHDDIRFDRKRFGSLLYLGNRDSACCLCLFKQLIQPLFFICHFLNPPWRRCAGLKTKRGLHARITVYSAGSAQRTQMHRHR